MYRTKKPKWYDRRRDYLKPDIEEMVMDLQATERLVEVIEATFFETHIDCVCDSDVMNMLSENNYHDGKARHAYDFLSSYCVLIDLIALLHDRMEEAADILTEIDKRRLGKYTICSSRTENREEIRDLMWSAMNVIIPEEIDNIGADVIDSVKSNTPEQELPVVAARYLMRIAYMLYRDGVYGRSPDEEDKDPDADENDEGGE